MISNKGAVNPKIIRTICVALIILCAIPIYAMGADIEFYEGILPDGIKIALDNIVVYPYELINGYQFNSDGGYIFLLLKQGAEYRVFILHGSESTWKLDTISNSLPILHGMHPQLLVNSAHKFYIDYGEYEAASDEDSEYYTFTICKQLNDDWMLVDYVYSHYSANKSSYHVATCTNHQTITMSYTEMVSNEAVTYEEQTFYGLYARDLRTVSFEELPLLLEEAHSFMDMSQIAMINNTNQEAKLFLRTRPDMESSTIGRYNNGVIASLLERTNDEWTKVRIGEAEGYMLQKYLLYGDDIIHANVPTLYRSIHNIAEDQTLPMYAEPNVNANITLQLAYGETMQILGTIDDQWSHVMLDCGVYGYVKTVYLWAGNE